MGLLARFKKKFRKADTNPQAEEEEPSVQPAQSIQGDDSTAELEQQQREAEATARTQANAETKAKMQISAYEKDRMEEDARAAARMLREAEAIATLERIYQSRAQRKSDYGGYNGQRKSDYGVHRGQNKSDYDEYHGNCGSCGKLVSATAYDEYSKRYYGNCLDDGRLVTCYTNWT